MLRVIKLALRLAMLQQQQLKRNSFIIQFPSSFFERLQAQALYTHVCLILTVWNEAICLESCHCTWKRLRNPVAFNVHNQCMCFWKHVFWRVFFSKLISYIHSDLDQWIKSSYSLVRNHELIALQSRNTFLLTPFWEVNSFVYCTDGLLVSKYIDVVAANTCFAAGW